MEILIQSIRIIEREENKISKRELPEEFSIYIKQWVSVVLANIVSDQPLDNIFTKDIILIMEIVLCASLLYLSYVICSWAMR